MRTFFAALLLAFAANALAIDTFDAGTSILKMDSVVLGGIKYNGVVVRLKSYDVVSVASSGPYVVVSDTCSSSNITVPIYNAIAQGMTLDQVNQTIGCKYDPSFTDAAGDFVGHVWRYGTALIKVYFDATDSFVRGIGGGDLYKVRVGF